MIAVSPCFEASMRTSLAIAMAVLLGARAAQAQDRPVAVGDTARLVRQEFCWNIIKMFSCDKHPVDGVVDQVSSDAIRIRIAKPRSGLWAKMTTGEYRDTLVDWRPWDRRTELELLRGRHSRASRIAIGGAVGAGVGLAFNELLGRAFCWFSTPEDCSKSRSEARLPTVATFTVTGVLLGSLASTKRWHRMPRNGTSILPLVIREQDSWGLGVVVTSALP